MPNFTKNASRGARDENHRKLIPTADLVEWAADAVLKGTPVDNSQVALCRMLLGKTMPDMRAVEQSFDTDKPIEIKIG